MPYTYCTIYYQNRVWHRGGRKGSNSKRTMSACLISEQLDTT